MEIDIISGFFGAGKTTFLNKYLVCLDDKIALIENEFGDIGLDASLVSRDINIKEINSGCICCTLQMDFRDAIKEIYHSYDVERIIIEPSGIGKLSYIASVCEKVKKLDNLDVKIGKRIVIVDASSFNDDLEDFGEFYTNQISYADIIFLNRLDNLRENDRFSIIEKIKELNNMATIHSADYRKLSSSELMNVINNSKIVLDNELGNENNSFEYNDLESITINISKIFTKEDLKQLEKDIEDNKYGDIIRAKGVLNTDDVSKKWHFDYTTNYFNIEILENEKDNYDETRIIFIGKNLNHREIESLK